MEQLAVFFRWNGHKDFIGFYQIPDISANGTESVLQDVLIRLQLSLNVYRGQCYYRATNVIGKNSSVGTKTQEKHLKDFPTHCHCHSLSLGVRNSTKKSKLLSLAIALEYIYIYIYIYICMHIYIVPLLCYKLLVPLMKYLPKRKAILSTVTENLEEDVAASLSKFSGTSWTAQAKWFKRKFEKSAFRKLG